MATKPKILVTHHWPTEVEAALAEAYEVTLHNQPLAPAQWAEALHAYDAICPCVADKFNPDLEQASQIRTRLIANYGVGYNHINLDAARSLGITVTNTPDVLTDATADLAMTLMLMIARRAGEGERQVRSGAWHGWYPTHLMGSMVTGATLGVVGMGRIGQAMARKAHYGFGMSILYHNRRPSDDLEVSQMQARFCADVDELLGKSDFVAIHCPGGKDTYHLFSDARFSAMQPHAFLINTSRGDVVDESALVRALDKGLIAGAALDVYEKEPSVPETLMVRENVVLLPHLGSATLPTRTAMGMKVKVNLDAFFSGKPVPDKVC